MNTTKIEDLPFTEDKTIRIKIIESKNGYITFFVRTDKLEDTFKIERPKNKYWKNVKLNLSNKINIKIQTVGKKKTKQLIRVG